VERRQYELGLLFSFLASRANASDGTSVSWTARSVVLRLFMGAYVRYRIYIVDHDAHFEYVSRRNRSGRCAGQLHVKGEEEIGVIRSAAYPLRLWPRSLQAQATNHRAAANIAKHTRANSAVPRSAVRRSPRRLSVSLIMGLRGSSDDSINYSALGFVPSPPFQKPSLIQSAPDPIVNWRHFCLP
jgi:hypothetical protein